MIIKLITITFDYNDFHYIFLFVNQWSLITNIMYIRYLKYSIIFNRFLFKFYFFDNKIFKYNFKWNKIFKYKNSQNNNQ